MKNEKRFPLIAELAKLYLAIPATNILSERVFSKCGLIFRLVRYDI